MMSFDRSKRKENNPATINHLKDMIPPNLEVFTHILGEWYAGECWVDDYSWDRVWKQVTDLSIFPNLKRVEAATYWPDPTEDVRREIWSRSELLEKEKGK